MPRDACYHADAAAIDAADAMPLLPFDVSLIR